MPNSASRSLARSLSKGRTNSSTHVSCCQRLLRNVGAQPFGGRPWPSGGRAGKVGCCCCCCCCSCSVVLLRCQMIWFKNFPPPPSVVQAIARRFPQTEGWPLRNSSSNSNNSRQHFLTKSPAVDCHNPFSSRSFSLPPGRGEKSRGNKLILWLQLLSTQLKV